MAAEEQSAHSAATMDKERLDQLDWIDAEALLEVRLNPLKLVFADHTNPTMNPAAPRRNAVLVRNGINAAKARGL